MGSPGRKIVLVASDSESSEYMRSTWRQMLLACLPQRFAAYWGTDWSTEHELTPDGQAKYVPHGLRIIESLLLEKFSPDDIAVCYTDQVDLFVGDQTQVVGIHAHNPLGITFATDVYVHLYGRYQEPVNAYEFRRMITHPTLKQHKPHMKIIVGGPGSWQIEKKNLQDEWLIDTIVDGEAEEPPLHRLHGGAQMLQPRLKFGQQGAEVIQGQPAGESQGDLLAGFAGNADGVLGC